MYFPWVRCEKLWFSGMDENTVYMVYEKKTKNDTR